MNERVEFTRPIDCSRICRPIVFVSWCSTGIAASEKTAPGQAATARCSDAVLFFLSRVCTSPFQHEIVQGSGLVAAARFSMHCEWPVYWTPSICRRRIARLLSSDALVGWQPRRCCRAAVVASGLAGPPMLLTMNSSNIAWTAECRLCPFDCYAGNVDFCRTRIAKMLELALSSEIVGSSVRSCFM